MITLEQIKVFRKYQPTHRAPKEDLQLLSDEQWERLSKFQRCLWIIKNKPELCPPEFKDIIKQMMQNECKDESTYQILLDTLLELNKQNDSLSWINKSVKQISVIFSTIKKIFRINTLGNIS